MATSNLQKRLEQVRSSAEQLPTVASAALGGLVEKGEQRRMSPEGERWARTKAGAPFDPQRHIRYVIVVRGGSVYLDSSHPAARFTRFGTRHMMARGKVPRGESLGWWLQPLLRALRAPLQGRG